MTDYLSIAPDDGTVELLYINVMLAKVTAPHAQGVLTYLRRCRDTDNAMYTCELNHPLYSPAPQVRWRTTAPCSGARRQAAKPARANPVRPGPSRVSLPLNHHTPARPFRFHAHRCDTSARVNCANAQAAARPGNPLTATTLFRRDLRHSLRHRRRWTPHGSGGSLTGSPCQSTGARKRNTSVPCLR